MGAGKVGVAGGDVRPESAAPMPGRLDRRDLVVLTLDLARRRSGVAGGGRGTGTVVGFRPRRRLPETVPWVAGAWAVPSASDVTALAADLTSGSVIDLSPPWDAA